MLNIIDDFVKPRVQNEIEEMLMRTNFPYFYSTESVHLDITDTIMPDNNSLVVPQFFHMFVIDGKVNSQQHSIVAPVTNKLIETIDEAFEAAIERAALETFEGRYDVDELTQMIDVEKVKKAALNLII